MRKQFVGGNLTGAANVFNKGDRDMLSFTVASNSGKDYVEYTNCSVWGKKGFADKVLPYLVKGQGVTTHGELVNLPPVEKDNVVYNNVLVNVKYLGHLELTGGKRNEPADKAEGESPEERQAQQQANEVGQAAAEHPAPAQDYDSFDDDIPF